MCDTNIVLCSNILILIGRSDLSVLSIPIILEYLFSTFSECFFQLKCVYTDNPRKLKLSTSLLLSCLF